MQQRRQFHIAQAIETIELPYSIDFVDRQGGCTPSEFDADITLRFGIGAEKASQADYRHEGTAYDGRTQQEWRQARCAISGGVGNALKRQRAHDFRDTVER